MSEWCAERTNEEAMKELESSRIPVGEFLKAKDVMKDPHIKEKGFFQDTSYPGLEENLPIVGPAVELSANPGEIKLRAPLLGEHNDKILTDLGYTKNEIEQFKKDRVI